MYVLYKWVSGGGSPVPGTGNSDWRDSLGIGILILVPFFETPCMHDICMGQPIYTMLCTFSLIYARYMPYKRNSRACKIYTRIIVHIVHCIYARIIVHIVHCIYTRIIVHIVHCIYARIIVHIGSSADCRQRELIGCWFVHCPVSSVWQVSGNRWFHLCLLCFIQLKYFLHRTFLLVDNVGSLTVFKISS